MIRLQNEIQFEDIRIRTASGMFLYKGKLFLVCDDQFGIYEWSDTKGWSFHQWTNAPTVGSTYLQQKKIKLDLECVGVTSNGEKILAFPSGSTVSRNLGLTLNLQTAQVEEVHLGQWFGLISKSVSIVNIEGYCLFDGFIYLLNRGVQNQKSVLIKMNSNGTEIISTTELDFGSISGVLAHGTELAAFDNRLFALFSAEDTNDTYNDGAVLGSGMAEFDFSHMKFLKPKVFDQKIKAEGLVFWKNKILLCSDPDGNGPSQFFSAEMEKASGKAAD